MKRIDKTAQVLNVEDLATQSFAGLLQLGKQRVVNIPFASFLGNQIPEVANLGLTDSVDSPESLLDPVGIPRQVVIHHQVCALQVDAFARGVRGN